MSNSRYVCPECEGEFDEPVEITAKTLKLGVGFIEYDAKGCPWCGKAMTATGKNPRKTSLLGVTNE